MNFLVDPCTNGVRACTLTSVSKTEQSTSSSFFSRETWLRDYAQIILFAEARCRLSQKR